MKKSKKIKTAILTTLFCAHHWENDFSLIKQHKSDLNVMTSDFDILSKDYVTVQFNYDTVQDNYDALNKAHQVALISHKSQIRDIKSNLFNFLIYLSFG